MKQPHEYAKEITHFVNGGEVEYYDGGKWHDFLELYDLNMFQGGYKFRVKPATKTVRVAMFRTDVCGKSFACLTDERSMERDSALWYRVSEWVEIEYEVQS
jgi:hypothetical protein